MNLFLKNLVLPKFKRDGLFESVLVEFREYPHVEFIIRNTILKLGTKWSHTVICGKKNFDMMYKICKTINPYIKVIKIDKENMTQGEYSQFLMTKKFWDLLKGEKIFIYQEDSLVFKNNIDEFLEYDYIGAPFSKKSDDTPNCVGNGGLSLRSKSVMLSVINKIHYDDCVYNSSTLEYMKSVYLEVPPEDVYFSKCIQEYGLGLVADWDSASDFSSESVYNENSFGGHKFWISNPEWPIYLKKIFNCNSYIPHSDLNKYLKYINKPESFNKNNKIENAFDIDFTFFSIANNFFNKKDSNIYAIFKSIGLNGFVYHPKQIQNFFSQISLYRFLNNLYIISEENNAPIPIQDFLNKHFYNSTFDYYSSLLIKKKYTCLNDNFNTLFLVFIGHEKLGINLLSLIIEHKNINKDFNIAICFNSDEIMNSTKIKKIIKNNFDFYAIYKSKNLGTDITSTILMYNEITKTHNFEHIYKFHTKSILDDYEDLTNYLLDKSLDSLLEEKNSNSNCIGHPSYYLSLEQDMYNNKLKQQYNSFVTISNRQTEELWAQ
jgi:hypothetical protein